MGRGIVKHETSQLDSLSIQQLWCSSCRSSVAIVSCVIWTIRLANMEVCVRFGVKKQIKRTAATLDNRRTDIQNGKKLLEMHSLQDKICEIELQQDF